MDTGQARTAVITCQRCGRRNRIPVAATGTPRCGACKAELPWLVEAGDDDYDAAVQHPTLPVLVDVWAPWCGPCRTMAPHIEQLARERAGRLKVVKVNADEAPRTAARLQVRGIPTVILLHGGREQDRTVGAQTSQALRAWLDRQPATA